MCIWFQTKNRKKQIQNIMEIFLHFHTATEENPCISGAQLKYDFWNNVEGKKRQKGHSCNTVTYGFFYISNTPD